MSTANNYLDITLLGKEYRVACPPEEREALLAAVAFVDEKMHDIAEKTKSNVSERIAVMAARREVLHRPWQPRRAASGWRPLPAGPGQEGTLLISQRQM